jgi:D-amino-acid oxidase
MRTLVLGAGVSGLSSAIRLIEAGHSVEIWTREMPAQTTSAIAAAIWYPYRAEPAHRVLGWARATFGEFVRLAGSAETGVIMRDGLEVFHENGDPWWAPAVPAVRHAAASELPAGCVDGYVMSLPVVDMSIYLPWLHRRVLTLGGALVERTVATMADACAAADLVINCTGLGSGPLLGDRELFGVRGQILVVDAPQVSTFLFDESTVTYIVPRLHDVVLGGTAEEHVYETTVSAESSASIRKLCARFVPGLEHAPTRHERVGLRPCRSAVRLEAQTLHGSRIIHNYGHGGAGVTLSWGCADEVVRLV